MEKPSMPSKEEIKKYEDSIQVLEKKCEGQRDHINSLSTAYNRVKSQVEDLEDQIEEFERKEKSSKNNKKVKKLQAQYQNLIGNLQFGYL